VGRIDNVLVRPSASKLEWCALEMQAVYFSGRSMQADFALMRTWLGPGVPFPTGQRRPDFRSSGPKTSYAAIASQSAYAQTVGKEDGRSCGFAVLGVTWEMKRVPHISNQILFGL